MKKTLINKINSIALIVALLLIQIGFAQKTDETLPQTVIFKVKENYRANCSRTGVAIPNFNKLIN